MITLDAHMGKCIFIDSNMVDKPGRALEKAKGGENYEPVSGLPSLRKKGGEM